LSEIKGRRRQFEDLVILYKPKVKIAVLNYERRGGGSFVLRSLVPWPSFSTLYPPRQGRGHFVAHRVGENEKRTCKVLN